MTNVSFLNACACMGPQGGDPYCPCRMQKEGLNGYYNCHGDMDALAKRSEESRERLHKAMKKLSLQHLKEQP